jgi:hypothetical protein
LLLLPFSLFHPYPSLSLPSLLSRRSSPSLFIALQCCAWNSVDVAGGTAPARFRLIDRSVAFGGTTRIS